MNEVKDNEVIKEGSWKDRLLDMVEESVIVQSLVTLLLLTAQVVVWLSPNIEPTAEMNNATVLILGFWMGQKMVVGGQMQAKRIATKAITEANCNT